MSRVIVLCLVMLVLNGCAMVIGVAAGSAVGGLEKASGMTSGPPRVENTYPGDK